MTFPVDWTAEICAEASKVLQRVRRRIQDDQIDGQYWAAYVYERAIKRVRRRRT